MFTRFDANKSTKGASKLRRDLINSEIANLRDLLPLPQSTRQRLSQLQLMALVCVYVRKANYFQQVFKRSIDIGLHSAPTPNIGFSKALSGFLMMLTQNGKLLYISDNAAEYLGHSMEDLLIHGDSVYDIIDKQDHGAIQSELNRGVSQHPAGSLSHHHPHHHSHHHHHHHPALPATHHHSSSSSSNSTSNNHHHHLQPSPGSSSVGAGGPSTGSSGPPGSSLLDGEQRIFLCRMNVSRNARRQMRFGDQKVVLVQGHYLSYLPLCSRNEPVFIATCTPIAMPETRECVVQGATNVFTTIHSMDMKVVHIDKNGEFHLGYSRSELQGVSWYQLLHWESTREAQSKHRLITQSEQDRSCILLVRMQRRQNDFLWVHVVLQVRDGQDSNQQSVIVCTNQVLSDREASVMLSNSWLYHYYTVQSKMQFGIPFEGATRIPQQQQPPQPPQPQSASSGYAGYTSTSSGHSPGAGSTGGVLTAPAMHGGYSTAPTPQPHSHLAGYHGYHSPSATGHHNGGTATPMLQGQHHHHHQHHANHHQHLQHHQQQQQQQQQQHHQPGPSSSSTGEEYVARGYGFRLDGSGTQPVDYSGGHPTPPTSAPPTPAMSGQHGTPAIPIPVVQLTPHIRCHNGNGQSSAAAAATHGDVSSTGAADANSSSSNNTASDHRPPAKKRNRLEPLSIPDNSGQSPDSPETSTPLGDYHHSGQSTGHMENGGTGSGDGLHGMNGLDGTLGSTSSGNGTGGGGGGGGGLQAMVIGTLASNRTTALGRLHAKSVILPPTVASLGSEPTDFMEQWNPSPPWSDTTAQKVPDISHQELSPYMTTTPPTPTSAPHQMLNGGGFPTATTFSFDWMPEQFVPIVTDCGVTSVIPHPGTIVTSQTMSGVSGGTLATLTSGHGSGSSNSSSSSSHAGHVGMVHSGTTVGGVGCVLPPSCLTQDGLPIPGMSLPMVPVPLPIPPPPWPSDHRLLALDGTSSGHGMTSASSSETGSEERKPLDDSRTGHTGHEQH
ncbi:uncharacterized protein LOC125951250 [Anopheles darlingi]|uniref:uncharacterized protein LOC125951250 n=1 Tax=Anopheles darlingi TaxID=43151 RepID=UPI0021002C3E|nr:uncharacterized protein LOC125951250 [Anopheles darlingi]